jgi:hypothetical protein
MISTQSELQQKVIKTADRAAWLLDQYGELLKAYPSYDFIKVYKQKRELVIDLRLLYERVGGWGLSACRTLAAATAAAAQ